MINFLLLIHQVLFWHHPLKLFLQLLHETNKYFDLTSTCNIYEYQLEKFAILTAELSFYQMSVSMNML